jgi:hypothetical protein
METEKYEKKLSAAADLLLTDKRVVKGSKGSIHEIPLQKVDSVSYAKRTPMWAIYTGAIAISLGIVLYGVGGVVSGNIAPLVILVGFALIGLALLLRRGELIVRSATLNLRTKSKGMEEFVQELRKVLYRD